MMSPQEVMTLITIAIGAIALGVVICEARKSKIQKIVDNYVLNPSKRKGEGLDILVRAGATSLSNRNIEIVCNEIVKRGFEHPFGFCQEVLQKRTFKKTLKEVAKRSLEENQG